MKRPHNWTSYCSKINKCKETDCSCFMDYKLWYGDEDTFDFSVWRDLANVERNAYNK